MQCPPAVRIRRENRRQLELPLRRTTRCFILASSSNRWLMQLKAAARVALVSMAVILFAAPAARAQQPAAAAPAPEVGTMAPDFSLPGATRYGLLRDPVRLSDLRGSTVVLAFFYRARTKG